MLKKAILASLTLFATLGDAAEFKTFPEMVSGLNKGVEFVFVVSLADCQSDTPMTNLRFSVKPNAVLLVGNKKITASDKHFTLNNPNQPDTPVIEYSKFTINANDHVQVQMSALEAKDYHLINSHGILCQLGQGFRVFSSASNPD